MILETTAFVRDQMICAEFNASHYDLTRFLLDGVELDATQSMIIRNQFRPAWKEYFGKTSCMKMFDREDVLYAEYYLNGELQTSFGITTVLWVKPDEGFRLRGASK